jgi:hypothetical protein
MKFDEIVTPQYLPVSEEWKQVKILMENLW